MEDKIFIDFEPNDFIVRITPLLDENHAWTGELRIGSITTDDNNLSDEEGTIKLERRVKFLRLFLILVHQDLL